MNENISGAMSGALNRDSPDAIKHAELYYAEIRNRNAETEIKKISKNTGFSESNISDIRNHLFFDKIKFEDGSFEQFSPDYDQAQSWQRLVEGNYTENDILLLNHELAEIKYIQTNNAVYEEAHKHANQKYNWETTLKGE